MPIVQERTNAHSRVRNGKSSGAKPTTKSSLRERLLAAMESNAEEIPDSFFSHARHLIGAVEKTDLYLRSSID